MRLDEIVEVRCSPDLFRETIRAAERLPNASGAIGLALNQADLGEQEYFLNAFARSDNADVVGRIVKPVVSYRHENEIAPNLPQGAYTLIRVVSERETSLERALKAREGIHILPRVQISDDPGSEELSGWDKELIGKAMELGQGSVLVSRQGDGPTLSDTRGTVVPHTLYELSPGYYAHNRLRESKTLDLFRKALNGYTVKLGHVVQDGEVNHNPSTYGIGARRW